MWNWMYDYGMYGWWMWLWPLLLAGLLFWIVSVTLSGSLPEGSAENLLRTQIRGRRDRRRGVS
ncbi:MAG: hypothetical protein PVI01_07680 [Gemmatimonadales bacterium]|jgi:hypothetical protein